LEGISSYRSFVLSTLPTRRAFLPTGETAAQQVTRRRQMIRDLWPNERSPRWPHRGRDHTP